MPISAPSVRPLQPESELRVARKAQPPERDRSRSVAEVKEQNSEDDEAAPLHADPEGAEALDEADADADRPDDERRATRSGEEGDKESVEDGRRTHAGRGRVFHPCQQRRHARQSGADPEDSEIRPPDPDPDCLRHLGVRSDRPDLAPERGEPEHGLEREYEDEDG